MQGNTADVHLGGKEALFLPSNVGGVTKAFSFPLSAVTMPWSLVTKHASHLPGFCKTVFESKSHFYPACVEQVELSVMCQSMCHSMCQPQPCFAEDGLERVPVMPEGL